MKWSLGIFILYNKLVAYTSSLDTYRWFSILKGYLLQVCGYGYLLAEMWPSDN